MLRHKGKIKTIYSADSVTKSCGTSSWTLMKQIDLDSEIEHEFYYINMKFTNSEKIKIDIDDVEVFQGDIGDIYDLFYKSDTFSGGPIFIDRTGITYFVRLSLEGWIGHTLKIYQKSSLVTLLLTMNGYILTYSDGA